MSSSEFLDTTTDFQIGTFGSMIKYLTDASIKDGLQDSDITLLIEQANKGIEKTGYKFFFVRTGHESSDIKIGLKKYEKESIYNYLYLLFTNYILRRE